MPMIFVYSSGSTAKLESFLKKAASLNIASILEKAGQEGVLALARATPARSGLAAGSWTFDVETSGGKYAITWRNIDIESGFPVAIMLQYGYGTGTGGYVAGRDYINPAIQPIFDKIADEVWKAVTTA